MKYIWIALAIGNLVSFGAMGLDKARARAKARRIPERTLFLLAALGGGLGALAGMYCFRHKTRHWYFVVGMPAILLAQLFLLWKSGVIPLP